MNPGPTAAERTEPEILQGSGGGRRWGAPTLALGAVGRAPPRRRPSPGSGRQVSDPDYVTVNGLLVTASPEADVTVM